MELSERIWRLRFAARMLTRLVCAGVPMRDAWRAARECARVVELEWCPEMSPEAAADEELTYWAE